MSTKNNISVSFNNKKISTIQKYRHLFFLSRYTFQHIHTHIHKQTIKIQIIHYVSYSNQDNKIKNKHNRKLRHFYNILVRMLLCVCGVCIQLFVEGKNLLKTLNQVLRMYECVCKRYQDIKVNGEWFKVLTISLMACV